MARDTGQIIPLSVIGGFLGSGKTTLINNILRSDQNFRTAVLVNDFGSINVDEHLIAAAGGQTLALTNGCVCCSIGDDLTKALIQVSEMRPIPDWIVIEASGVADPRQIAQVGVVDPVLIIDGVIVLVDGAEIKKLADDPRLSDTTLRQLRAADVLVLNKADLVSSRHVQMVQAWLETLAPTATVHVATDADIPWELLRSPTTHFANQPSYYKAASRKNILRTKRRYKTQHDRQFVTWTYQTAHSLKKKAMYRLLRDMPPQVLRAKGLVRLDSNPDQEMILQFAGQSRSLKPTGKKSPELSQIVFIGVANSDGFAQVRAALDEAEL